MADWSSYLNQRAITWCSLGLSSCWVASFCSEWMAILCQLFIFLSFVNWELGFFVLDLLWLSVPCSPKCGESIGISTFFSFFFSNCNRLMNRCLYRQSTKSKEETSKMKEKKSRTQTAKAKVCLLLLLASFVLLLNCLYCRSIGCWLD